MALQILDEGMADGASGNELAQLLGVGLTTLQRWRRQFAGDGYGLDRRKGSRHHLAHRLSKEECQRILLTCYEPEFAALPPGRSCRSWRIGASILFPNAAFIECSTPMGRPIGVVEHAHLRSPDWFHACGPQARIKCGAGASPVSPPCARCVAVLLPGDLRLEPQ